MNNDCDLQIMEAACPCFAAQHSCVVCQQGYHIFCNQFPHGDSEEAYQYFIAHPEVAKSVRPIGESEPHARALQFLQDQESNKK